jgi:hypothetical protein
MADDAGQPAPDTATRVATTVAAVAAAFVAQRALVVAWRTVTGHQPDEDVDSSLTEVVVFAAVSAATIAVARTLVSRRVRAYMQRSLAS